MAADGSIKIDTRIDTGAFEHTFEDIDKMCDNSKRHIEKMAKALDLKTNPINIVDKDVLKAAEKEIQNISKKIQKIKNDNSKEITSVNADKNLRYYEAEQKTFEILSQERKEIDELKERQKNLTEAVDEYKLKQVEIAKEKEKQIQLEKQQKELERQRQAEIKAAEKQQKDDIKSINSDVSGTVAGDDFVSKIKNAEQYEATLEKVKAKMQTIEQKTAKLAAQKGIDGSDALNTNREYQKLKKQYDALIASANKFKHSSKGSFNAAADSAKNLGSSMQKAIKQVSKYTLALFGARSGFYAVKNAIRQVLSDNEKLNNTVTAMKGAFANALAPVIERVVYWLKYAFAYLNLFVKVLTGVDMAAQYNAKAINKQTEATRKNAKATKEANKQLAAFDEKNVLTANNQSSTDAESANPIALLDLPDVSGGKFEQICELIKNNLADVEAFVGGTLIAVGLVLLVCGQIPLGIAAIVAGVALEAKAIGNADEIKVSTEAMISTIMMIAGGALLAIGLMLCTAGQLPAGLAAIAIGVALMVSAIAMEVNKMPTEVQNMLLKIMGIAGASLLALGVILILAAGQVPLGIALIAAGAALLVTAVALAVDKMPSEVRNFLQVVFAIASVAMLVLGIILLCTGVHLMLGVALLAAGAALLVTTIALNWNKLSDETQKTISVLAGIVSGALLVLGIILCATGAALPLGVALIAAGAVGLVTAIALNWNVVSEWVSKAWSSVKSFWNSSIAPIFTTKWWSNKLSVIAQGAKSAINSAISYIERGINWIVSKLNLLNFNLPDGVAKVVGFSTLGFNLPYVNIPRLAKGGIVNNPGRGQAVIAGEAGAEAILPLQNNTEWMDMLVDKVADRVSMNVVNRITIDGKDVNSSNKKYDSRFAFATNGGVL